MNLEDEEFLPESHPLNAYLKSIDMGEDIEQTSFQPQAFDTSQGPILPSLPRRLDLLEYFRTQVRTMKAAMIKRIITSEILVEEDSYIVQHYLDALGTSGDSRKMHLPPLFLFFSFGLTFVLTSLHFLALLFCIVAPLSAFLPFLISHCLLRDTLVRIHYFHTSFRKSILFMQGLACSERGLTFVATRTGQGRISTTFFPNFLTQLHMNLVNYIGAASELSLEVHNELGGFLGDLSPDILAVTSEPSLSNLRDLHEYLLFLDSEVLRRMACLLSSEPGFSVRSGWRLLCLLTSWNWKLRISSSSIESLNDVRQRLLIGKHPSQQPRQLRGANGNSDHGPVIPTTFVSHLDSLNHHLVNWCERIRVLREKALSLVPNEDTPTLSALVSEDLQLMRYILKNCETCLNEAESVITIRPLEENSEPTETVPPSPEINRASSPVKLEAVDLPIEDEVIEAVADPDSVSPSNGDLGICDNDIYTGGLDLKTLRQRSENRSLLLSELNSVIAHRLNETREREKQALLKSKGLFAVAKTEEAIKEGETEEREEPVDYEFNKQDGETAQIKCISVEVLQEASQGTHASQFSPVNDITSADAESTSESTIRSPDVPCPSTERPMRNQLDTRGRHSPDFLTTDESEAVGESNVFEPISVGVGNLFGPLFASNLDQLIRHRQPPEETFDDVATGEDASNESTVEEFPPHGSMNS